MLSEQCLGLVAALRECFPGPAVIKLEVMRLGKAANTIRRYRHTGLLLRGAWATPSVADGRFGALHFSNGTHICQSRFRSILSGGHSRPGNGAI